MRELRVVLLCVGVMGTWASAHGQALTFCVQLNRADGLGLAQYSDAQIQNGLCMTSRELAYAIARYDRATERECNLATVAMFQEFKRRFPGRDYRSAIGRC